MDHRLWDKCHVSSTPFILCKDTKTSDFAIAPQQYMAGPPPPGAYGPPPNSAGRPSMPPTPIPGHAHPYYHQSPQRMMIPAHMVDAKMFTVGTVQHAMPYPMMMPPPGPNGPPHPYETGPPQPIPMGGVGHA